MSSEFRSAAGAAVPADAVDGAAAPSTAAILEQTSALALDVLDEVRSSLMVSFRFLDVALWHMPFEERRMAHALASDGYRLYYDPLSVVLRYRESPDELFRDYLHVILHCIFHHPFDDRHPVAHLWDLACDAAVEATALEAIGRRHGSPLDKRRAAELDTLAEASGELTAQRIYRTLVADAKAQREQGARPGFDVGALAALFSRDEHGVWTRSPELDHSHVVVDDDVLVLDYGVEITTKGKLEVEREDENDDQLDVTFPMPEGMPAPSVGGLAIEADIGGGDRFIDVEAQEQGSESYGSLRDVTVSRFKELKWKDISGQIQMDMQAFTGKAGNQSGNFLVNLSVANRKTCDYRDFLKRFCSLSEEMKVSTDEFDYIYYTYGLEHYDNMPLIEPLEYQESNRVKDFVIAIDVSASTAGELVRHFVEKTYDILKSTSGFGRKMNVHIVQCDCDIRSDTVITATSDIDREFELVGLKGFGGTDFRPVFKYVNELVERRELLNLKGFIYLTDGLGTYPVKAPDYETVFVFVDDDQRERKVPPWAMKVLMDGDEIMEL